MHRDLRNAGGRILSKARVETLSGSMRLWSLTRNYDSAV